MKIVNPIFAIFNPYFQSPKQFLGLFRILKFECITLQTEKLAFII